MKKIGIIGGGAGGLITSSKLAKDLSGEIKKGDVSITLFDRKKQQEFQPGYLEVAFRGEKPDKIRRETSNLIAPGVRHVISDCKNVDLDNKMMETEDGKKWDFDYLIISTGSSPDYDQIPGLKKANMDFHTSASKSSLIYSRIFFLQAPSAYPPMPPSFLTTLWQGTIKGTGFDAHALATALCAFGMLIISATC